MPSDSANGSTVTFDAVAIGEARDISFSEDGNPIDVTVLGDTIHTFVNGATTIECTVEIVGSESTSAVAIGDTGALAIAWNDSGSESVTSVICTNRSSSGSLDTEITTSYTFQPTPS